jgi:predicted membrane-bound spermidine synthase
MGGMALGAWIAGAALKRIKNSLKLYAFTEIALGVAALVFHSLFQAHVSISYNSVLTLLKNPALIFCYKWLTSSAIILPQSMLLGATFPLMAAGFIRRFPGMSGYKLTFLYFTNTFGASMGVLLSGFALMGAIGLHGTIVSAGIIDIVVGCAVLLLSWRDDELLMMTSKEVTGTVHRAPSLVSAKTSLVLVLFAGATAAASFMYEIGWIRMLSLVLGSSTHSFEMMLSSFILGMALGSFFIRKRIDTLKNIPQMLVIVQVVMGATALISILVYGRMFHFMKFVMDALSKNEQGYILFNVFSDIICMLVMLPSTICAGMVLPLIVHYFYKCGCGETYVGRVYAVNTFGGILGVIAAVWLLMPLVGVRFLVTIGALIDIGIGLYLLFYFRNQCSTTLRSVIPVLSIAVIIITISIGRVDPILMSSGVFRNGVIHKNKRILSLKDGRTATIALYQANDKMILSTNGKVDASVDIKKGVSGDEYTMSLAAVVPLAILPDSSTAAVIGMGSGMTAHYLLMDSTLKCVDVVEIEPAMVEAAQHIGKKVENTFKDPRSHIFIEDAKSFFSSRNARYDIIVSEPSNPWVSGVSGLFSKEFFERIQHHLTERGVLVQWFHKYESDITILSSIFRALRLYFPNYQVYTAGSDLIVVASKDPDSRLDLIRDVFNMESISRSMSAMGFTSLSDLHVLHYCSGQSFNKLLNAHNVRENSDYYPYVDLYAVKHRFIDREISQLDTLRNYIIPVLGIWENDTDRTPFMVKETVPDLSNYRKYYEAKRLYNEIMTFDSIDILPENEIDDATYLFDYTLFSPSKVNFGKIHFTILELLERTLPWLSPSEMVRIWEVISEKTAEVKLDEYEQLWMDFFESICRRNFEEMKNDALQLLPASGAIEDTYLNTMLVVAYLIGSQKTGETSMCAEVLGRYEGRENAGLLVTMVSDELKIPLKVKRRFGIFGVKKNGD